MIKRIINKKIQTLTLTDIESFSDFQNLSLTLEEKKVILNFIKKHPTLIYQELDKILKEVEENISPSLYQKLKPLIIEYYHKYKNYL